LSTKPLTAGDFLATLIFSTIFQDISVGTWKWVRLPNPEYSPAYHY
jgi:hypothetical protein